MTFFLVIFLSYMIGSIPFGLLLSLIFKKKDPRFRGSNNIGATNITRISGWKLGLATLLLDVFKAFVTVKICSAFNEQFFLYCSIAVFLGHLFPIWLKFKGGKGIAVFIGILFSISPVYGLIFLILWFITAKIYKYSSLSALVSCLIILLIVLYQGLFINSLLVSFMTLMVFFKHKTNIKRLLNKEESKIKF